MTYRKFALIIFLVFAGALLSACSSYSVDDFISFDDNLLLTYEVEGDLNLTFMVFNSYSTSNRLQRRLILETGQVMSEVLEVRGGQLVEVNSFDDFFQHTNMTGQPPSHTRYILAEPIRYGNTWIENPRDDESEHRIRQITGVGIEVMTPAGTFETIEVTTIRPHDDSFIEPPRLREYFAPGIGVVKSIDSTGISTNWVGWEYAEEVHNTARLTDIRHEGLHENVFIFYDVGDAAEGAFPILDVIYTTNNDLTYLYSQVAQMVLYTALGHGPNEDVSINFAIVNPANNGLNLDFCAALMDEMARAESYEHERRILYAIATTFGILYNTTGGVRITVDGVPYNSGRVTLGSMEFIPVGQGLW